MNDDFGDRMKRYEGRESDRTFMPFLPTLARLDGRSFHTFCRGLEKPYDENFHSLMVEVTRFLMQEAVPLAGYTQSDEISLVWTSTAESQAFFNGRAQKMTSILAALASVEFNRLLPQYLPKKAHLRPVFDCRVWQVPTREEAANTFLWRENDASRNSVLAAGQAVFSHKELQGLGTKKVQEKLFQERNINWNDYPAWAKRGSWFRRRWQSRPFTTEDLEKLPPKHHARTNPHLFVGGTTVVREDMPRFGSVNNRAAVIFDAADPETT